MAATILRNPRRIQLSRALNLTRFFSSTSTSTILDLPTPSDPRPPNLWHIKSTIRNETDADKIVETFTNTTTTPRSSRDRSLFTVSVQKLKKLNRPDLVEKILEQQKQDPSKTEGFWIRIIMLYSNARMLDHAIRTFDEIKPEMKTVKSLCALLSACLENKRYDLVHQFAKSVPLKTGIETSLVVHNLVMRAFIGEGKIEKARELLGKVEADVTTYNVLLTGYSKKGDKETFQEVLEEMKKKGLEGNLVTYNMRIGMLCKNKECDKAKELIDEMVAKKLKPNETSFNLIIYGFCKAGDYKSAKSVFEKMRSDDDECVAVKPNADSYMSFIPHAVKIGEFEYALELCKESIKRNWVPPFASVEGLVKGLVSLSKVDEAKKLVEAMKKKLRGSATNKWTEVEALLPLQ